jgi:hypothetical protein
MTYEMIQNIPKDRTVTYGRILINYKPQKYDPNHVCIMVGGNLIKHPFELTTRNDDIISSKIIWNSVLSTPQAKYICIDIKTYT